MELPSPPPPRTAHLERGAAAEAAARLHLENHGFLLIAANYRSRRGEVDLIMRSADILVFAEVRLRSTREFGGAAASVTRAKQQKIIASAQAFLQHHPELARCNCRFDVLAVQDGAHGWEVEWLPAAFTT
jgi:putative endonuclease